MTVLCGDGLRQLSPFIAIVVVIVLFTAIVVVIVLFTTPRSIETPIRFTITRIDVTCDGFACNGSARAAVTSDEVIYATSTWYGKCSISREIDSGNQCMTHKLSC